MASNKKSAKPSAKKPTATKTTKKETKVEEAKKEETTMATATNKENVNVNNDNVVEINNANAQAQPEAAQQVAPEEKGGRPGLFKRVKNFVGDHKVGIAFTGGVAAGAGIGVAGKVAYDHYQANKADEEVGYEE